jgi:hypothetical protein
MHYDPIGHDISISCSVTSMSGRDKLNLLQALMNDLGLVQRIQALGGTAILNAAWADVSDIHW